MIDFTKPNPKYKEILKLKEMLDKAKIPYEMITDFSGYIIHYPTFDNYVCSAVEHRGSYGQEEDLIEIMGLLTHEERSIDSVSGFHTAQDVFERIKKHYESEEK